MEIEKVVRSINWKKLTKQKIWLCQGLEDDDELGYGLLHLIDAIQDAAVSDGIASENEVFSWGDNYVSHRI